MEKRGGWKTSRMTPLPKRGVIGPPLIRYVFHPPQVSVLCFSCTKFTTEQTRSSFGGVQNFSGGRVLWYVFLPPYVLHPPISRPKLKVDKNLGKTIQIAKIGFGDFAWNVGPKTPNDANQGNCFVLKAPALILSKNSGVSLAKNRLKSVKIG